MDESDKQMLDAPFTMDEVEKAVKEIKGKTAPRPDGFPVGFYKEFWMQIKGIMKEAVDTLYEGT